MIFPNQIKKYILITLTIGALSTSVEMHAGLWDRFTNWYTQCYKKSSTLTGLCTVAASAVLGGVLGCLLYWCRKPDKQDTNEKVHGNAKSMKQQRQTNKKNATGHDLNPLNGVSLKVVQTIEKIEQELNPLISRITTERSANEQTKKGWDDQLNKMGSKTWNLLIRCEPDIRTFFDQRFTTLMQKAALDINKRKKLYECFTQKVENIKHARQQIDQLKINAQTAHKSQQLQMKIYSVLDKVFANEESQENYDAYIKGSAEILNLQITHEQTKSRLKLLFQTIEENRESLNRSLNGSFLRAPIRTNNLERSTENVDGLRRNLHNSSSEIFTASI